MPTPPIARNEKAPERITRAIEELQQGRSNAHGTVTLDTDPATSTVVQTKNCGDGSHVDLTPTTANAAALAGGGTIYIVAAKGSFTIHHVADANNDNTFTYAIQG